jgi:hypothetical protein
MDKRLRASSPAVDEEWERSAAVTALTYLKPVGGTSLACPDRAAIPARSKLIFSDAVCGESV